MRREPEVHLPLIVGCRKGYEDEDATEARLALDRAGFKTAPMSTLAIAALCVQRLRTTALGLHGLERQELVDVADTLEGQLVSIKTAEEAA